ncbi:chymotrypsin-2-like [Andrena cerasifolii]|uniref:chymotrypsin-2-like n=1 Tax=Andrena cerasifolii TaxID=2819439 RepID=UPI00403789AC
MYALIVLFMVCSTVSGNGSLDTRIVGGNNALDGKYPYQASIKIHGSHICGGSIIHHRYILTAAHCINTVLLNVCKITVGTNRIFGDGDTYQAQEMMRHPSYRESVFDNDIGLIKVDRDIIFGIKVQPINLAFTYDVPANTSAIVTGWGRLTTNGTVPYIMQELNVTIISQATCSQVYGSAITKRHLCTFLGRNKGVCNGDSGGPLVVNNVQVGIVSFGRACALGYPDVYTRVYSYKSWITNEIYRKSTGAGNVHRGSWTALMLAISTIVSYLHLAS